jgi:hypothetical protein
MFHMEKAKPHFSALQQVFRRHQILENSGKRAPRFDRQSPHHSTWKSVQRNMRCLMCACLHFFGGLGLSLMERGAIRGYFVDPGRCWCGVMALAGDMGGTLCIGTRSGLIEDMLLPENGMRNTRSQTKEKLRCKV